MDAGLIAIGTKADTTIALSISNNHRASVFVAIHRSSEAEGDQTERLASPSPRRRSTSGGDEAAAIEAQRVKKRSLKIRAAENRSIASHFAATIPRPRVCRHGCRKTVRSRSQDRMSA